MLEEEDQTKDNVVEEGYICSRSAKVRNWSRAKISEQLERKYNAVEPPYNEPL